MADLIELCFASVAILAMIVLAFIVLVAMTLLALAPYILCLIAAYAILKTTL